MCWLLETSILRKRRVFRTDVPSSQHRLVEGAADFAARLDAARTPVRDLLRKLYDWAVTLEQARLVNLYAYHGRAGILTLLPRLQADDAGLVSIYNNNGSAYLQFWRSVFVRRAPTPLLALKH